MCSPILFGTIRFQGTVRVPAVCQYAHKLALMVGESIRKQPNKELQDRLWFLWKGRFYSDKLTVILPVTHSSLIQRC